MACLNVVFSAEFRSGIAVLKLAQQLLGSLVGDEPALAVVVDQFARVTRWRWGWIPARRVARFAIDDPAVLARMGQNIPTVDWTQW